MSVPGDTQETRMPAVPATWSETQRQATLDTLAHQFHMTITEEEVFQAATLFFALLRDGAFVEQGKIVARMQEELARAQAFPPEATGRLA